MVALRGFLDVRAPLFLIFFYEKGGLVRHLAILE